MSFHSIRNIHNHSIIAYKDGLRATYFVDKTERGYKIIRHTGSVLMPFGDNVGDNWKDWFRANVDSFEIAYMSGGNILLAPNGKPSNLTPEQYRLVRTPAFKKWFGDWEKAYETENYDNVSKVIDEETKEPLVVYHRTKGNKRKFNVFQNKIGKRWYGKDIGLVKVKSPSYFFSDNPKLIKSFGRTIIPCFLKIINPLTYDTVDGLSRDSKFNNLPDNDYYLNQVKERLNKDKILSPFELATGYKPPRWVYYDYEEYTDLIRAWGFDGVLDYESFDGVLDYENFVTRMIRKTYIVFESNQIKLADGTNTTFDANNPDIRFNDGGNMKQHQKFARGGEIVRLSGTPIEKLIALEKMITDRIDKQGGGHIKAKVLTTDNTQPKIERFAKSSGGSIIKMITGKKRYGRLLSQSYSPERLVSIQFYEESKERSYADDLKLAQKYIQENRHPNLWDDLARDYDFDEQKFQEFKRDTYGMSHYDAWSKAYDYGLPRRERYKTITMQSAGMPSYAQQSLKEAIENKRNYSYSWDCGYDCRVSTEMGTDGIYRGWFSQEYRGTGNGHYWLLISPTQAIFAEKD